MNRSKLHLKRMVTILALTLMLAGAFVLPVQATMLDFTIGVLQGGTVSYAGGAAPLIGSGIDVSFVVDKHTVNPPIAVSGGLLSFSTGPQSGSTLTQWNFGGGSDSWIKITGAVLAAGITDTNTVLLQGTFGTASVFNLNNPAFNFNFNITGASFMDTKNDNLLKYFGIAAGTPFVGAFNLSFSLPTDQIPPEAFTSTTMGSGDLFNSPVPVPATALLLGTGLLGLVGLGYRRKKKS